MYSNNKLIRDVADVAARIMSGQQPVTEKLHPNQQKLDVHEPEKDELTADDFKKLRAKKLKEDVTNATQRLKAALDRHVAQSLEASRNDDFEKRKVHQDYIHKIRNQLGKLAKNEEVEIDEEQLDELSKDTLASYEKKSRVAAHKHALASELKGLAADPAGSYAHKQMADKRHAGWKVAVKKLNTEESELDESNDTQEILESKSDLADRMYAATEPYNDDQESSDDVHADAMAKHGKKFADQLRAGASKMHFPRDNHTGGYDKLASRVARSASPTHVTKGGKLTKNSQKGLKASMKEEVEEQSEQE